MLFDTKSCISVVTIAAMRQTALMNSKIIPTRTPWHKPQKRKRRLGGLRVHRPVENELTIDS